MGNEAKGERAKEHGRESKQREREREKEAAFLYYSTYTGERSSMI